MIMPTDNTWGPDAPLGIIVSVDCIVHHDMKPDNVMLYRIFWIDDKKINTCIGNHIDLAINYPQIEGE